MTIKTDISMQADSCIFMWVSGIGAAVSDGSLNSHEVEVFTEIVKIVLADPTVEVCGYLERTYDDAAPWVTMAARQVDNVAEDDDEEFSFSSEDTHIVYELLENGDCLGIWHSHPSGYALPSITDWIGHPRDPNLDMYIIAPTKGRKHDVVYIYRYTEDDRP